MNENNISNCDVCGLALISEEIDDHKCRKREDTWIIDGQVWVGDGVNYYPFKKKMSQKHFWNRSSTDVKHEKKSTEDEPECCYFIYLK